MTNKAAITRKLDSYKCDRELYTLSETATTITIEPAEREFHFAAPFVAADLEDDGYQIRRVGDSIIIEKHR